MCNLCKPATPVTKCPTYGHFFRAPSGETGAAPQSITAAAGKPRVRVLIKGGSVLSMDDNVGNFAKGDVLIDGAKIIEVAATIDAPDAMVIDGSGKIVMPGFVDTHHHQFETGLRSTLSDAIVVNDGRPENAKNYYETMLMSFSQHYRPEDVYINELYGGLAQLDAGVTTVMDVSQIHHSAQHSDAAVEGLRDAGRRGVFGYF